MRSAGASVLALPALPHIPRMPQRIAPRLRPDREAMRHAADGDRLHRSVRRVDGVDGAVVAGGEPQRLAVSADIAHVRAAAIGDRPVGDDFPAPEIVHRYAAGALPDARQIMRAAI